jgi:hypothetical protein
LSQSFLPFPTNEGQSKNSRNSFTSTVWCTISSYRLDRVLLVTSPCKFCRGSGVTSDRQGQWFLHPDNAPCHTSRFVERLLVQKNILVVTQPPYSLDLAPSDFWLLPNLKISLKGTRVAFNLMSTVATRVPLRIIFRVGNSPKVTRRARWLRDDRNSRTF